MKILLVEDENNLARTLKLGLEREGYTVDTLSDGDSALRRIGLHHGDYDLVILDLTLPKLDGLEVCRRVREQKIEIPILMLTARTKIEDRVLGLKKGADDYLIKPFSFEELLERVRALLRRPKTALSEVLTVRDLRLNTATRKVYRGGKQIDLTLKEFAILEFLLRHKNAVVNREQLFSNLWDFACDSFSNVIDVHIRNLRKKIDSPFDTKLVSTVRGVGYQISD